MEDKQSILIIEDEDRIRRLLTMYLERDGFKIDEANNGFDGLELAKEHDYQLIILDLMLPGIDGIEVCKGIREVKATPIIMLTAKGEEANRIEGFEAGADDYVVKPFSPREVVLRVKALLRRVVSDAPIAQDNKTKNILEFEHLIIDNDAHRVSSNSVDITLTPKEYELLFFLASNQDKVFDREQLLKEVWKYEFFGDLRTVDTHIKRLREKLSKVSQEAAQMIVTVWGVGYKFEVEDL
ncbi:two-component system, OmpR family, response regulator ResD [Amphibacillus marinus]|uniref:Two-component system, OmpR family, response regulator ResD n=1 Tax=Amphibacillus marinus TaxID=872970 RepID=A0A1H8GDJ9_9BACI|nr:response regulator transcription factor [Amphibacillus marinus]SEN41577.1 two-component system, OmpR family, response regulator ResD [Amphibacillus marinus]